MRPYRRGAGAAPGGRKAPAAGGNATAWENRTRRDDEVVRPPVRSIRRRRSRRRRRVYADRRASTVCRRSKPSRGRSPSRAIEQHAVLVRTLRDRGVDVTVLRAGHENADRTADRRLRGRLAGRARCWRGRRPSSAAPKPRPSNARCSRARDPGHRAGSKRPGCSTASDVAVAGDRVFVGVPRPVPDCGRARTSSAAAQLAAIVEAQGGTHRRAGDRARRAAAAQRLQRGRRRHDRRGARHASIWSRCAT